MIGDLYRQVFQVRKMAVLAAACLFAALMVLMVTSTRTFRVNQEAQTQLLEDQNRQLVILSDRVAMLQAANSGLASDAEKAKAQANTSVDQLVKEGIPPIVASPEVLDVPTATVTTTAPQTPGPMQAPPVVVIPQPQPTQPPPTDPPPTNPPPTDPPPTQPPPTDPPPTDPPPTEPPPEPTTTTTQESQP